MRPLRVAALVTLAGGAFGTIWLLIAARGSYLLPFAAAAAVDGLLVFMAADTARSRGRWAARGLWLILFGALSILVSIGAQLGLRQVPEHYPDLSDVLPGFFVTVLGLWFTIISLLGGGLLWILAYRLDRPRAQR